MTIPRLIGTHHHATSNIVGPGSGGSGGTTLAGLAYLTNNDAGTLAFGDVVVIDTSGNSRVKKVTISADPNVIGVVADTGPYAVGALTPILLFGYHSAVKVSSAAAVGDYLKGSATSGKADPVATVETGVFGRALSVDSAGVVVAEIYEPAVGVGSGGSTSGEDLDPGEILFDMSGMTDGIVSTFMTPDFFYEDTTRVHLNGLLQRPIVDYNESTTLDGIVMVAAPASGDELLVEYLAEEV